MGVRHRPIFLGDSIPRSVDVSFLGPTEAHHRIYGTPLLKGSLFKERLKWVVKCQGFPERDVQGTCC